MTITDLLIQQEGEKLKMYLDSEGNWTIGIGHNLSAKPISLAASRQIFADDLAGATKDAERFPWFYLLNPVRQAIVLSMIFNMGVERFMGFVKLIAALIAKDYIQASAEILDSRMAKQTGKRAEDLAAMMQTGEWMEERG